MSLQTPIALFAAGLAALYFIRGAVQDLRGVHKEGGSSCGKCSGGGCPVAQKG